MLTPQFFLLIPIKTEIWNPEAVDFSQEKSHTDENYVT